MLQLHLPYYTSPGTACFHYEINYATTSSLSHHLQSSHTTLSGHLEMGAKFKDGVMAQEFCHHMAGLLGYIVQSLNVKRLHDLVTLIKN